MSQAQRLRVIGAAELTAALSRTDAIAALEERVPRRAAGPTPCPARAADRDARRRARPSREPLLAAGALPAGAHVNNAIGAYRHDMRELSGEALRRAPLAAATEPRLRRRARAA